MNTELLGSMEFACRLAGSKLVVVLGHTSCGAVKGAISSARLGNLTRLVQKIDPAVEAIEGERDVDNADYVDGVAEENVAMVIAEIRRESSVLAMMEQERAIRIVGGMYDVSTGAVRFSDPMLRVLIGALVLAGADAVARCGPGADAGRLGPARRLVHAVLVDSLRRLVGGIAG